MVLAQNESTSMNFYTLCLGIAMCMQRFDWTQENQGNVYARVRKIPLSTHSYDRMSSMIPACKFRVGLNF